MNAKELAAQLNGREYLKEITKEEEALAKLNNLIVAFGYSDDNLELRGAVYDEVGAWEGKTITIDADDLSVFPCKDDDDFCEKCFDRARKIVIDAEWSPKDIESSWRITSDAPFEPFNIFEDGELFCVGAVITVAKQS